MTLIDLEEYIQVKEKMLADYEDRSHGTRKSLTNIAKAGFFIWPNDCRIQITYLALLKENRVEID